MDSVCPSTLVRSLAGLVIAPCLPLGTARWHSRSRWLRPAELVPFPPRRRVNRGNRLAVPVAGENLIDLRTFCVCASGLPGHPENRPRLGSPPNASRTAGAMRALPLTFGIPASQESERPRLLYFESSAVRLRTRARRIFPALNFTMARAGIVTFLLALLWVAADARLGEAAAEHAEFAQFDAIALCQGFGDSVEGDTTSSR